MAKDIKILTQPLKRWELRALDKDNTGECPIDHVVSIDLGTLFEGIEATNDYVSEAITGTCCLQDIAYKPVGAQHGEVLMRVKGYILLEDLS